LGIGEQKTVPVGWILIPMAAIADSVALHVAPLHHGRMFRK